MLPATVLLTLIATTVLKDSDAYLSESAIKKTQQMLKNVCSKKHSIEEDVFNFIKNGKFPDNNNDIKCYFSCIFKTMQMVNQKGMLDKKMFKDKMTMMAPPNVLKILLPAIEQCIGNGNDKGSEICQSSYDFIKCAYTLDPTTLEYLPL
ncbi:uncharacterized protein LOC112595230 [Melanaphis sacchari]|uniref:uncharacterized protein LOC112595230 n=1 Tax=Melanaphis sacchari TaxID=742174 RepID=UPI000DC13F6A|nr:uncharacterized protein LOC112595230 [Melanaphis sacchari]XP_025196152.1 uncharacterized protein LOC112595230 [Melanaphis sacchari]